MTLIVTVITKRTIYQSADFRLTNLDTGKITSDTSTKLITLQYGEWDGFVAYTGIGRWNNQDTSEFALQWLDRLDPASPEAVAERIRDMGTEWLSKIEVAPQQKRHTFILASFGSGIAQLMVISNFEDCFGRNDAMRVRRSRSQVRGLPGGRELWCPAGSRRCSALHAVSLSVSLVTYRTIRDGSVGCSPRLTLRRRALQQPSR